jgi:O-antigen/teichoic acid export membrane protein
VLNLFNFNHPIKSSRLVVNAASGIFQSILNILLLIICYPAYLYFLGVELYGLWATLSIIIVLSQMGNLSIHTALSKYIANNLGNLNEVWKLIGASIFIILIVCSLVIFITNYFKDSFAIFLELDAVNTEIAIEILPFIGILAALIVVVELLKGISIGFGYMYYANFTASGGRFLQVVMSIIFLYLGYGINALLYAGYAAYLLMGIVLVLLSTKFLDSNFFNIIRFKKIHLSKLTKFGFFTSFTAIVESIIDMFSKILITKNLGLDLVTFYEAGLKIIQILQTLFSSAARAIMPEISKLSSGSNINLSKIKSLKRTTSKVILLALIPLSLLIILFGKLFISFWLQGAYDIQIYYAAIIFLIAYLFNILSIPHYQLSIGTGNTLKIFIASLTRLIFYVIALSILNFLDNITFYTLVGLTAASLIPEALIYIHAGNKSLKNLTNQIN